MQPVMSSAIAVDSLPRIVWPDQDLLVRRCAAELLTTIRNNPARFPEGYALLLQRESELQATMEVETPNIHTAQL